LLIVLALFFGSPADSPDPTQLIHQVSEKYSALRSVELSGHLTAAIPDTEVKMTVDALYAEADHSFLPSDINLVKLASASFERTAYTDANGNDAKAKLPPDGVFGMPYGWDTFDRADFGMKSATELPVESIEFGGHAVPCRVIQVEYDNDPAVRRLHGTTPEQPAIKYWIDPRTVLVLKDEFLQQQPLRGSSPAYWRWVYTVDSVKLNQPPPQWLIDVGRQEQQPGQPRPSWVGRTAPDFALPDLDGHELNAASLRGSVVVLDFWATWCGPCREELPIVQKIAADYKSQGVQVWGIAQGEELPEVKKWMSENGSAFPTLLDPESKTRDQYGVQGIPALVVVGKSGKIVSYFDGTQSEQSLRSAVEAALHEVPASK
jgi:peroxiredoxin